MSNGTGWIGVDLDGTLAKYAAANGKGESIGAPIEPMVARVRAWLAKGVRVKIMTARAWPVMEIPVSMDLSTLPSDERMAQVKEWVEEIRAWCVKHIGVALPITCAKDFGMIELWDDRAVQVVPNTGVRADGADLFSGRGGVA